MQEDLVNRGASSLSSLLDETEALPRAFDDRFRTDARIDEAASLDVLTLFVGDTLVGVRVEELAQIVSNPGLVRVPDAPANCIGIAGRRGKLVAVFDLGGCVGLAGGGDPRTIVVSRRDPAIAFAVDGIDRYRRVATSAILAGSPDGDSAIVGTLVDEVCAVVVSVDALVRGIERAHAEGV